MGKKKPKKYKASFKAEVGFEALKGTKTVAEISSEYKVHATQINKWKQAVKQGLPELFEKG